TVSITKDALIGMMLGWKFSSKMSFVNPGLDLSQFNYELPPELIAQTPAAHRSDSRLLHLDSANALHDRQFADLPALLQPNDLLVFNNTRVIKARLLGRKDTGGKVEVLIERITQANTA